MENEIYIQKLKKMIDVETINNGNPSDLDKFSRYQEVLQENFPLVFSKFKKQIFNGSLLLSYEVVSNEKPICLMSHQDVVGPNGKWDTDPFNAVVIDNKLYGRGTLDTKGNFFAFTQAIEELLENNFTFTRSIYIISSCNEETTGKGMLEITNYLKDKGVHFELLVDEGGMIVDNFITKSNQKLAVIALGEKRCIDVKFTARGKGGHASTPDKNYSLLTLTRFINKASKYKGFVSYFEPTNQEMLRTLAPTAKGIERFLFKHAHGFRHLISMVFKKLSPMTRAMIQTTICFTCIQGSDSHNAIPTSSSVIANIRISHKEGYDRCINKLKKLANKYNVEMEVTDEGSPSSITSYQSKAFTYLKNTISTSFYNVIPMPYIANGASDSRMADVISDNVFRFAPFTISPSQLETIHSVNENVDVNTLPLAVNFFKTFIGGLNNGQY